MPNLATDVLVSVVSVRSREPCRTELYNCDTPHIASVSSGKSCRPESYNSEKPHIFGFLCQPRIISSTHKSLLTNRRENSNLFKLVSQPDNRSIRKEMVWLVSTQFKYQTSKTLHKSFSLTVHLRLNSSGQTICT